MFIRLVIKCLIFLRIKSKALFYQTKPHHVNVNFYYILTNKNPSYNIYYTIKQILACIPHIILKAKSSIQMFASDINKEIDQNDKCSLEASAKT